ncbi:hypothetical protein ES703_42652 [subsurface metagenome]
MKEERPSPYIWVTWLTKLLAGESQCEWAAWFRSHYKHDKLPSDFDLAKWTAEHNELLHKRRDEIEAEGFTVYTEDQNSFRVEGAKGITLSGKADIVAIKENEAYVEDCKTGNPKTSDHMQVLVYMLTLPLATTHCKGLTLEGRIIYKNSVVEIPSSKIDDELRKLLKKKVHLVGGVEEPRKVPSWGECRFCDISKADCPERIGVEPTATSEDHDLF